LENKNKFVKHADGTKTAIPRRPIKEIYTEYVAAVESLSAATDGRIDISKSGWKVPYEARKQLYKAFKMFDNPEPITALEQQILMSANKGGLIFAVNGKVLENYVEYDINSSYPYHMSLSCFSFPIRQPEFRRLEALPDILQYGVYHCKIMGNFVDDHFFRFGKDNWYSHYDINSARELKFEIILNPPKLNAPNAMIYPEGRMNGHQSFNHLVNELYDLKLKGHKLAKYIMNTMYGSMCQKDAIKYVAPEDKPYKLDDDKITVLHLTPHGGVHSGLSKVEYLKKGKYFKFDFARLGVFLTSYCRLNMVKVMLPLKNHVYRCHTDGIIFDDVPEVRRAMDRKVGDELGDWKTVCGACHIYNPNFVLRDDDMDENDLE
jgi:hypothetical protein